ncbi:MAG TPA: 16S rRNA (guanine(966)-N(2))-methyltransferase RsmD [Planctomycetota bacterium]|nr:16S rRNA (guanine(966)-N(2))-methyltransferase RsmD [Planctomycetota bacterium]
MLRIIAGQARGRQLQVPTGGGARPMDSRARGALFNILQTEIPEALVLDVYAGSGSLGLEALSRGARGCVFVDRDRASARALEANLEATGLSGGEVLALPAAAALKTLAARGRRFHVAFFDPPFRDERDDAARSRVLSELTALEGLLEPGGCIVWRLERRNFHPEELPASLEAADRREYGRSLLVFLRRRTGAGSAPPEAAEPPAAPEGGS